MQVVNVLKHLIWVFATIEIPYLLAFTPKNKYTIFWIFFSINDNTLRRMNMLKLYEGGAYLVNGNELIPGYSRCFGCRGEQDRCKDDKRRSSKRNHGLWYFVFSQHIWQYGKSED